MGYRSRKTSKQGAHPGGRQRFRQRPLSYAEWGSLFSNSARLNRGVDISRIPMNRQIQPYSNAPSARGRHERRHLAARTTYSPQGTLPEYTTLRQLTRTYPQGSIHNTVQRWIIRRMMGEALNPVQLQNEVMGNSFPLLARERDSPIGS